MSEDTVPLVYHNAAIERERLTIMIKIKENRQQHRKRDCQKYIPDINIPKLHQPPPLRRRIKRLPSRQRRNINIPHMANIHESSEEDNRQRRPIIFQELAHVALEETAASELAANPAAHEDEEGYHDT